MKSTPFSPDAQLLRALREAGDDFTAPAELAEQNSLSATALRRRIAALRELGYEIESDPHHGLRLLAAPDALYADDLRSRLPGSLIIGREIHVYEKTASTNDVLERLARDGVKEGVVVFAEHQTRGRGRLGRDWFAPARKSLCFSVLLRPPFGPQAVTRVTVTAATAVARGIESSAGLAPQIKWPNDILLRGRKTAGILTELRGELDQVRYILLGIGINVNLRAADFPPALRAEATSLQIELGQPADRADLAAAVLRELEADYRRLCQGEFEAIADEWEARCHTLGKNISVRLGTRVIEGRAESIDNDGLLLVRTRHGHLERITGGDVSLRA